MYTLCVTYLKYLSRARISVPQGGLTSPGVYAAATSPPWRATSEHGPRLLGSLDRRDVGMAKAAAEEWLTLTDVVRGADHGRVCGHRAHARAQGNLAATRTPNGMRLFKRADVERWAEWRRQAAARRRA